MKHTKGEWVTNETGLIRSKEGVMIAQKLSADNNDSEAEANAKLIAAAPELLEALECAYLNCVQSAMTREAKELIENAIQKATS